MTQRGADRYRSGTAGAVQRRGHERHEHRSDYGAYAIVKAVLVDSSVVLDLFTADPVFYDRSLACIAAWGAKGDILLIDEIAYAEVSIGFTRIEELDEALFGAGFIFSPAPREALFLAGKAFRPQCRRGGVKTAPLPDFIYGAHAAISGIVLTRDPNAYGHAFPGLSIIRSAMSTPVIRSSSSPCQNLWSSPFSKNFAILRK